MEIIDEKQIKNLPNNVFVPLLGVKTNTATAGTEIIENVVRHAKLPLPKIHKLPGFMQPKSKPIALVGGGPSLKKHIELLKTFETILVCGSPNDYIMEQGIIPTYTAVCDPDAIMAKYLTKLDKRVTYLVASGCNDEVFKVLDGQNVVLWHCHSDEYAKQMQEADPEYFGVGGGCTVGLRGLSIAIIMGYQDIHFFGFDSCVDEDNLENHHAYKFATKEENIGEIYEIRVGNLFDGAAGASKVFHCAGYQLAQAEQFKVFYSQYGKSFRPTFYGGGLLEATARVVEEETHRAAYMMNILPPPDLSNLQLAA